MVDAEALAQLPLDELEARLVAALKHQQSNKLDFWHPYKKQFEFIALGKTIKERLLIAGNQFGKSEVGAYELACHLTGLYPSDWPGRRYEGPNDWWAAGVSTTAVRDIQQTKLCGDPAKENSLGTGFIPAHCFAGKPTLLRGVGGGAFDTVSVWHHNADGIRDGISMLQFKSYEQGRGKFQGKTLSGGVWWDEEPPEDIYTEGNARWTATDGMSLMTFTPLLGMSQVVTHFLEKPDPTRRAFVQFRSADCPHMTPEKIADTKSKYPQHEWPCRLEGDPFQGSGAIFRTPEEAIKFPVSQIIPEHWAKLWGIDFGISHPFAAVLAAWDRDRDVIYITATYAAANTLPIVHAQRIMDIAGNVPIAWPHDGHAREKGTGESLAKVYKNLHLKMRPTHAQFVDGSISTEAAVLDMQQRLADGRLRVREDLEDFFAEYRMYHRDKDGVIVKLRDDLLSATMKIIMDKRHAKGVEVQSSYYGNRSHKNRPTSRGVIDPWTGRRPINTR